MGCSCNSAVVQRYSRRVAGVGTAARAGSCAGCECSSSSSPRFATPQSHGAQENVSRRAKLDGRGCGREDASDVDLREAGRADRSGVAGPATTREKTRRNACARLAQRIGNLPEILVGEH